MVWGGFGGGGAPEPGPTVLERIARLESIWGDHRVVMCSFTAGRSGLLGMGVGAYLFGEGYPSPMFQNGV